MFAPKSSGGMLMPMTSFILLASCFLLSSAEKEYTPVNTTEIAHDLIYGPGEDYGPVRFAMLIGLLPTPIDRMIVIVSGRTTVSDPRQIEGAVIFNQSLASMATWEPILQPGAGRLLSEVYPELADYYEKDAGEKTSLGLVCIPTTSNSTFDGPPSACLLFKTFKDGESTVTFDLLQPGSPACILLGDDNGTASGWPRTTKAHTPLVVDESRKYASYQSHSHGHNDPNFHFTGSLSRTVSYGLEVEECGEDKTTWALQENTYFYLCNYHGQAAFTLERADCSGLAFTNRIIAGFVVSGQNEGHSDLKSGIYLLQLWASFPILVLPAEAARAFLEHSQNSPNPYDLKTITREDFWLHWNFAAGQPPTTTTTTTTPGSVSGKVITPEGSNSTANSSSSSNYSGNVTSEWRNTTSKAMFYAIIGIFAVVVVLVILLIIAICFWSKRGKSEQKKQKAEDKSVSRATSSKVPSKAPASKVNKKGGGGSNSKMNSKELATKQTSKMKAAASSAAPKGGGGGGGKGGKAAAAVAPKAGPKGGGNLSSFQTSATAL